MALRLGDVAPDFTADTTEGKINFHEWLGNSFGILFSHPKDFTPVCTTELGYMAGLKPEFDKRNCKIIGLSVDPVGDHQRWAKDIEDTSGHAVTYPMIADPELKIAMAYHMLPEGAGTTSQGRPPAASRRARSALIRAPRRSPAARRGTAWASADGARVAAGAPRQSPRNSTSSTSPGRAPFTHTGTVSGWMAPASIFAMSASAVP